MHALCHNQDSAIQPHAWLQVFNVQVWRARHPDLAGYISGTVTHLQGAIRAGVLHEVCVVFIGPQGEPLDRLALCLQVRWARGSGDGHLGEGAFLALSH